MLLRNDIPSNTNAEPLSLVQTNIISMHAVAKDKGRRFNGAHLNVHQRYTVRVQGWSQTVVSVVHEARELVRRVASMHHATCRMAGIVVLSLAKIEKRRRGRRHTYP